MSDLFGVGGTQLLDNQRIPNVYAGRIASLRKLIDAFGFEIDVYTKLATSRLATHRGYRAIQAVDGVGA